MTHRVLLAHALRWLNVARLANAHHDVGFAVGAVAVADHPIHRMRSLDRTFVYKHFAARECLREAIETYRPDLIVPCDDRIVAHLSSLYQEAAGRSEPAAISLRKLIEASLGQQTASGVLSKRGLLADLSHLPDVHVPRTDRVESVGELRKWADRYGLPAVLKLDGTWGGKGIILAPAKSGIAWAYLTARARGSALRSIKRIVFDRDIEFLFSRQARAAISVQSYVAGRLANAAVACWRGEVVAHIAVEVVCYRPSFGSASVVRIVNGEEMIAAARSIARHFDLSGVYGLDFVLDEASKTAKLIEINPRATQIDHLPGGPGHDLPAALRDALSGDGPGVVRSPLRQTEIALFPQEWLRDRRSSYLSSAFHDVPFDEPELYRYYGYEVSGASEGGDLSTGQVRTLRGFASPSLRKLLGISTSNSDGTV